MHDRYGRVARCTWPRAQGNQVIESQGWPQVHCNITDRTLAPTLRHGRHALNPEPAHVLHAKHARAFAFIEAAREWMYVGVNHVYALIRRAGAAHRD